MDCRRQGVSGLRRLRLASVGRFETKWLAAGENLAALANLPGNGSTAFTRAVRHAESCSPWIRASAQRMAHRKAASGNGHYDCTCYQPLFVFNQFGDLEGCALRSGNVHSIPGLPGRGGPANTGARVDTEPIRQPDQARLDNLQQKAAAALLVLAMARFRREDFPFEVLGPMFVPLLLRREVAK